jgi:lipopolysaccharide transport system ATP-binding protein
MPSMIQVQNVSKCYHVYAKPIDRVKQALALGHRRYYREFWALRNINFSVEKGETVGIVGVNGSGKSTLLQLITGVLTPTAGSIQCAGRIAALLELGAGFNPEMTGRQNVAMNAAILGIERDALDELLARTIEFADIGEFIDVPVKTYSSGMGVRLAFGLQMSLPKEILIVDEALAVGDELFQRKCFAAIERFRDADGTVLFVSHSAALVKELCDRAVFLDAGQMIQVGPCTEVVENYQKFIYMREPRRSQFRSALMSGEAIAIGPTDVSKNTVIADSHESTPESSGDDFAANLQPQSTVVYPSQGAEILEPHVENLAGRTLNVLVPHHRYRFRYDVLFHEECRNVLCGMVIKNRQGMELGGSAHAAPGHGLPLVKPGTRLAISFEFTASLLTGTFYLNCGVTGSHGHYDGYLARIVDVLAIQIRKSADRQVTGFIDFDFAPTVTLAALRGLGSEQITTDAHR